MPALIALADFDYPTRSASGFLLRYVLPSVRPFALFGAIDRKTPFMVFTRTSNLVMGMGHGDNGAFTGQNEEVLLSVEDNLDGWAKGKFFKLLSCNVAKRLGPYLISEGAVAFQAYSDAYIWVMDDVYIRNPWSDPVAAKYVMPVVESMKAILSGKSNEQSYKIECDGYDKAIAAETDEMEKSFLMHDREVLTMLGDPKASVAAQPIFNLLFPPPPLIMPIKQPY